MKKYLVELALIVGHKGEDNDEVILRLVEYEITAINEKDAIKEAVWEKDKSGFSIWETYCTEI